MFSYPLDSYQEPSGHSSYITKKEKKLNLKCDQHMHKEKIIAYKYKQQAFITH